jgi:hypothetical protein
MEGSFEDMLWNGREKVGDVSGKCDEDEGIHCEMDTTKNKGGDNDNDL